MDGLGREGAKLVCDSSPPLFHRKPVGDFVRRNLFVYYVS